MCYLAANRPVTHYLLCGKLFGALFSSDFSCLFYPLQVFFSRLLISPFVVNLPD